MNWTSYEFWLLGILQGYMSSLKLLIMPNKGTARMQENLEDDILRRYNYKIYFALAGASKRRDVVALTLP